MTEEPADKAMNALKNNRILEENIFILKDNPPDQSSTDPHDNIMVHAPYIGWKCIHISDLQEHIDIYLCDYWTFCPPTPPPISNHD